MQALQTYLEDTSVHLCKQTQPSKIAALKLNIRSVLSMDFWTEIVLGMEGLHIALVMTESIIY